MKGARYDLQAIGGEMSKGRFYMIFRSASTDVYNDLRLNQPSRISRAIEKDVLALMRIAYRGLAGPSGVDGFKVELKVGYKNFAQEEYLQPHIDDLHIYAPNVAIAKFAENDITSQAFINQCIVLVNGNRVDVDLAQQ